VSRAIGDSVLRARLATSASTTFASITDPPSWTFEEPQRVRRVGVLAEHDDTGAGMRPADLLGGADALVGAGRRHPNVGQHDVGPLGLDRSQQRVVVLARRHDVEVGLRRQQPGDTLADQIVVLRQHHPDPHGRERIPVGGTPNPVGAYWVPMILRLVMVQQMQRREEL
jgi:hypothetical protein